MTDLVERVARAIFDSHGDGMKWEKASERLCELYRRHARAAIAAMREPTEAMVVAALRADRGINSPTTIAGDWRAMIDEALK